MVELEASNLAVLIASSTSLARQSALPLPGLLSAVMRLRAAFSHHTCHLVV
jgi:hypothetical protein